MELLISLLVLLRFSLSLAYKMYSYESLWVYSVWSLLRLDVLVNVFLSFGFQALLFWILLSSAFSLTTYGTLFIVILVYLVCSEVLLIFFSIIFPFFFRMDRSNSHSLNLSFESSDLLLNPSGELFISIIVLINTRISTVY